MRRLAVIPIGSVVFLLATAMGCGGPASDEPNEPVPTMFEPFEQQQAMTQLALDAGYTIADDPWYDPIDQRAIVPVNMPGCELYAVLASNLVSVSELPTSFTVVDVGNHLIENLTTTDTTGMTAETLLSLPKVSEALDCAAPSPTPTVRRNDNTVPVQPATAALVQSPHLPLLRSYSYT